MQLEHIAYGLFGLVGFGLIIYGIFWFTSGSKEMSEANATSNMSVYKAVTDLVPFGYGNDDLKFCDYYVASSCYTVFPGSNVNDYISDGIIPLVIKAGARLIELDVYSGDKDKPVVGLKNQALGYDYAKNSVPFEKCCVAIANTAFNKVDTPLASDPFILSLVFHTDKTTTMSATSEVLKTTLLRFMLGPEYAFHSKDLAQVPMNKLAGKLIIVSGGNIKGTPAMEELVNLSWSTTSLRRLTYMQASQPYDHEELIDSNRKTICMVIPDPVPDLKNNNPTILFSYGCQWNLMNYGSLDSMMELYVEQFQQGSIVVKPENLRYKPVELKTPKMPSPATHSFQPMSHTSPIYDSNADGDKAIII